MIRENDAVTWMVLGRCLSLMPHATVMLARGIHLTNVDGLALVAEGLTPKVALVDVGPAHGMHLANLRGRRSLSERLEEAPTRATVVAAHESEAVFLDVGTIMLLCLMPVAYTFKKMTRLLVSHFVSMLDPRCLYIKSILKLRLGFLCL